jgi:outer membrane biosynthesis protein TonB
VAVLAGRPASAADNKIVVEQFQGPGADRLRQQVVAQLAQQGEMEIVPDKKVAATEADLGLIQSSDAYDAVAKQLKANFFLGGAVSAGKKHTAKLTLRTADGGVLGSTSWSAPNQKKLMSEVSSTLAPKLQSLMAKSGAGAGGGATAAATKAEEPAGAPPPPPPEEKKPSKKEVEKAAEADKADEAPKVAEDEEKPRKRSRGRDSEDEDDTSVSARASRDAAGGVRKVGANVIDLFAGVHFFSRTFDYNQKYVANNKLPLQKHNVTMPAPVIGGEYYPIEYLGLAGSFEYTKIAASQYAGGNYNTVLMHYWVGLKPQLPLQDVVIQGLLAYGNQSMSIEVDAKDPGEPQVPKVSYNHVKAGAAVRLPLSSLITLFGGANYMHMLNLGDVTTKLYFPGATAVGGEAHAGLAVSLPWATGLEGRIVGDFRRIAFNMNSLPSDQRIAGGAIDQYLGISLQVAYRNGL